MGKFLLEVFSYHRLDIVHLGGQRSSSHPHILTSHTHTHTPHLRVSLMIPRRSFSSAAPQSSPGQRWGFPHCVPPLMDCTGKVWPPERGDGEQPLPCPLCHHLAEEVAEGKRERNCVSLRTAIIVHHCSQALRPFPVAGGATSLAPSGWR